MALRDAALLALWQNAKSYIRNHLADVPEYDTRLPVDLDGTDPRGVIRGDVALAALDLYAAQCVTRVLPASIKALYAQFIISISSGQLVKMAVDRAIVAVPHARVISFLASGLYGLPSRLVVQKFLEEDLRRKSHEIRKQLSVRTLALRKRRRLVQPVYTRRGGPILKHRSKLCNKGNGKR